ncbi:MAG: hypothetical protein JWM09_296 [Francisellaceae bacterium]|nr:hypothetical protein [Francisellaceae bacterium]
MNKIDVIIIGAGAAGLLCGIEACKRGKKVIILDHANKPGKKILMSGGGRCNFTNYSIKPENYISHNPHFCKSALTRYTQWDFIKLVKDHKIPFHEKSKGQLFCDNKSSDILNMLLQLGEKFGLKIQLNTEVLQIQKKDSDNFKIKTSHGEYESHSLVIATGGLSIPTMGASPFGYKIAEQFDLKVWPTRAGLVPFTLQPDDKEKLSPLPGVSLECSVKNAKHTFSDSLLFTHRGLSGPAILQISSYWQPNENISIDLLPNISLEEFLLHQKHENPHKQLNTILSELLPKRIIETMIPEKDAKSKLHDLSNKNLEKQASFLKNWSIKPNGTEGYRTAEVTLGGIDCNEISSKTFESHKIPGLYFIGEVLDVTGWLGGYNFQWAWSSGWAAGQVV